MTIQPKAYIVDLFVQWIYTASPKLSASADQIFLERSQLYDFADTLPIAHLRNSTVGRLFDLRHRNIVLPMSAVEWSLEMIPVGCGFCRLLVGMTDFKRGYRAQSAFPVGIKGTSYFDSQSS